MWWEKTVEYKFVLEADRKYGLDFAAPLSGIEERGAGDGVFSGNSKLVLVEFKRSKEELDSDKTKFTNYDRAALALENRDAHHFLVYGAIDGNGNDQELALYAYTYFSRNDTKALETLDKGVSPKVFNEYLEELISWKKVDGRSSGTVSPESISSVVGVTPKGFSSISLSEYIRMELPRLYNSPAPTRRSSHVPGLG